MKLALDLLRAIERRFLASCMLIMAGVYFFNILVREFAPRYASTFAWIEEATLFIFAWVVFVGLGLTLERGRHITMSAIFGKLPFSARRMVVLAINIVGLVFSLYAAKLGFDFTRFVVNSGQVSPTLNVTMGYLYGAIPVGFALLAIRYALELAGVSDRFAGDRHAAEW